MKEINETITYKDKSYKLVFDLNVMEAIQDEYGTIDKWGKLTHDAEGEPNIKAVIFGFREMLNEGIEIENDENGTDIKPLTAKQVGRLITAVGLEEATHTMSQTVINSTMSEEKN